MSDFPGGLDSTIASLSGLAAASAATAPPRAENDLYSAADPRRTAVALSYDKQGSGAPRIVAKGYGMIADNIIDRARAEGLYVHAAPEMVSMLMHVALDSEIPPALYQAVAEILGWLYQLESHASGEPVKQRPGQPPGAPPARPAKPPAPHKPVGPRRF